MLTFFLLTQRPLLNLFFLHFFFLEVFLGGLWTQKRVKTLGFLRFLKRLFEAPDGLLGSSLPILVKNCPQSLVQRGLQNWPKMGSYNRLCGFQKKWKKKKLDYFGFFLGAFLGTLLGPILGSDRPKRGQDELKRAIRSFKEPKSCIFKNLKKPTVF